MEWIGGKMNRFMETTYGQFWVRILDPLLSVSITLVKLQTDPIVRALPHQSGGGVKKRTN